MPQLQEHQLKVAGVAKVILDNLSLTLEKQEVVTACLLHDMGNLIKFDLAKICSLFPDKFIFTEEEVAYWENVKAGYVKKYGNDEHHATIEIAREIGASPRVQELINCIGFQNGKANAQNQDWAKKICAYSDMRVGPIGVFSLEDRFLDLKVRYGNKHRLMAGNENMRLEFEEGLREIEKQIFSQITLRPEQITESGVLKLVDDLKAWEI